MRAKSVSKQKQLNIVGANEEYKEIRSITMAGGRFYSDSEVNRSKKVAVLGPTVAKDLFPNGNFWVNPSIFHPSHLKLSG